MTSVVATIHEERGVQFFTLLVNTVDLRATKVAVIVVHLFLNCCLCVISSNELISALFMKTVFTLHLEAYFVGAFGPTLGLSALHKRHDGC